MTGKGETACRISPSSAADSAASGVVSAFAAAFDGATVAASRDADISGRYCYSAALPKASYFESCSSPSGRLRAGLLMLSSARAAVQSLRCLTVDAVHKSSAGNTLGQASADDARSATLAARAHTRHTVATVRPVQRAASGRRAAAAAARAARSARCARGGAAAGGPARGAPSSSTCTSVCSVSLF